MKGTPYTSAKRTQRRYEQSEWVLARQPSIRHDWQCHICHKWYSNYCSRNNIHLRCCERKEAKRIAHEERRRALIVSLPSPDPFFPRASTPDAIPTVPQSPVQEPSTMRDVEQGSGYPEHGLDYLEDDSFGHAPCGYNESLGKYNIVLKGQRVHAHISPCD